MARIKKLELDALTDLYDAATDDLGWTQFGDKLAHHLGVNTAGLWITENGIITEMLTSAGHAETVGPYTAHFAEIDPWAARIASTRNQVVLTCETFDERDLIATEFFNDFAKPFGHFRPMGIQLAIEPGVTATISVENRYTDNHFEVSDTKVLAPAIPHLRSIVRLRRLFSKQKKQADLLQTTLDAIAFGIITCHSDGQVALMNRAADELLMQLGNVRFSSRAGLRGSRKRDETRQLGRLIHDAANGGAGGVMSLAGRNGEPILTAVVSPAGKTLAGPGQRYAMVALQPLTGASVLSKEAIAISFSLSPAQASIAHALLNGSNVEDIVARRGVKVSTVRSQLAAIFARTGTANQRELVSMLSKLPALRV